MSESTSGLGRCLRIVTLGPVGFGVGASAMKGVHEVVDELISRMPGVSVEQDYFDACVGTPTHIAAQLDCNTCTATVEQGASIGAYAMGATHFAVNDTAAGCFPMLAAGVIGAYVLGFYRRKSTREENRR